MILRNFRRWHAMGLAYNTNTPCTPNATAFPIISVNGTVYTTNFAIADHISNFCLGANTSSATSNPSTYTNLVIGTGTRAVVDTDYCLENKVISGFTISRLDTSLTADADYLHLFITYRVAYTGAEAISIREIGLEHSVYPDVAGQQYGVLTYVLLARNVLDEAIVFNPGDVKSITFELTI